MKLAQYKKICSTCDEIISDKNASKSLIAIQWLHVVRAHPAFLSKYKKIFAESSFREDFYHAVKRKILYLKDILIILMASLIKRTLSLQNRVNLEKKKIDVLVVSHLIDKNHKQYKNDFYYGNLFEILSKSNYSVTVLLIDHLGGVRPGSAEIKSTEEIPAYILSRTLCIKDEIKLDFSLRVERSSLMKKAKDEKNDLARKVLIEAAHYSLSSDTKMAIRIGMQVASWVNNLNPKILLTTYEGHSWERVCFASSREVSGEIKCIAYQHAPLFKNQHAIFRNLGDKFNPDVILTSGSHSYEKFLESSVIDEKNIFILGSSRSLLSSQSNSLYQQCNSKSGFSKVCLVLPEGIESECNLLFSYAIASAKLNPSVRFILRLHPIISFEKFNYGDLPLNVLISNNSFFQDLENSTHIIYRGSSAAVQAVLAGAIPIYLKIKDEMTIDPMHGIENLIPKVEMPGDLSNIFYDGKFSNPEWIIKIQEYCKGIYSPINDGDVNEIFNKEIFER